MRGAKLFPVMLACGVLTCGCATVAMVDEPVTAVISISDEQNALHAAASAFCNNTRAEGWASGPADLGELASIFLGDAGNRKGYWKLIGADQRPVAVVLARIRTDVRTAAAGLVSLNLRAREIVDGEVRPTREDVTAFENVLIHARQSRASFADAFSQVGRRMERAPVTNRELKQLDDALSAARFLADEMAAARTALLFSTQPTSG